MSAVEMSTSSLTLRAGLAAGAAVMLLMLAGRWRPIGSRWWRSRRKRPAVAAMNVVRLPVADYRAPRWWERFAAVTGLGVITAVLGAIVATLIAVFLIFSVTTLTGLLK